MNLDTPEEQIELKRPTNPKEPGIPEVQGIYQAIVGPALTFAHVIFPRIMRIRNLEEHMDYQIAASIEKWATSKHIDQKFLLIRKKNYTWQR